MLETKNIRGSVGINIHWAETKSGHVAISLEFWINGGWGLIRRVFENNKRMKIGVDLGIGFCTWMLR